MTRCTRPAAPVWSQHAMRGELPTISHCWLGSAFVLIMCSRSRQMLLITVRAVGAEQQRGVVVVVVVVVVKQ